MGTIDKAKKTIPCDMCNGSIEEGSTVINGQEYCLTCANNGYVCSMCEDLAHNDDCYTLQNDSIVCDDCYQNSCLQCSHCEESYENYYLHTDSRSDLVLCLNCLDRDFHRCDNCDNFIREGDQCDNGNGIFCDSCYEEESNNSEGEWDERGFTATASSKEAGEYVNDSQLIGCEIEVEGVSNTCIEDHVPDYCGLTGDGSLDDGVEIITPPLSGKTFEETIKSICTGLKGETHISPRCGLHIHFDMTEYKEDYKTIGHLLMTYHMIEDILLAILPDTRRKNDFCRRLTKRFSSTELTRFNKDKWYKGDNDYCEKYNDTRYYGCNIHSIFYRGTVEIRYHQGTQNATKILSWAHINQKVIQWSIHKYDRKKLEVALIKAWSLIQLGKIREGYAIVGRIFGWHDDVIDYCDRRYRQFNEIPEVIQAPLPMGKNTIISSDIPF